MALSVFSVMTNGNGLQTGLKRPELDASIGRDAGLGSDPCVLVVCLLCQQLLGFAEPARKGRVFGQDGGQCSEAMAMAGETVLGP